jgi:hypothetical protein
MYLARKSGIAGKDEIEQAQALAIVDLARDILTGILFKLTHSMQSHLNTGSGGTLARAPYFFLGAPD